MSRGSGLKDNYAEIKSISRIQGRKKPLLTVVLERHIVHFSSGVFR